MKRFMRLFWIAVQGKETDFTSGSINRAILLLSIPMILEMSMEALFAVFDAFFVSKIGVTAVTTVGLTESVITVVYAIAIGISMAATAMVARRIGEKDPDAAARAGAQSMIVAFAFSTVISIFGLLYPHKILGWMGGSDELIAQGVGYTRWIFGGNYVIMFLFLLNGIFRGAGNAAIAMRSLVLANCINIVLDPCFIFGWGPFPELGVQGAAVATNIGRGTGVAYQLYILFKGSAVITLVPSHFIVSVETIKRLLSVSAGGMMQYIIGSSSWIFLMRIMSTFGEAAVAGYTLTIRLIIFTILPAWGVANAAATLVGQNLGANQPDRAAISAWRSAFYAMLFLLVVAIVFFGFAANFIRIFMTDPDVVRYGANSLQIICLGYVFFAYGMVLSQAFNGAGDTRTPTVINFICFWLMQIPLAYLMGLQFKLGPNGVFWAVAISETMLAFICIVLFKRGKWKQTQI